VLGDEVKNVRTTVPYSIISTVVSNTVLLFAFVITLLYTIGDLDTVLGDTTGLPIIQVYYQATKSKAATNVLVVMLAVILFSCLCNTLASVSRLTWAFARDRGLPFSEFFKVVSNDDLFSPCFVV
jgi:choline transport protein